MLSLTAATLALIAVIVVPGTTLVWLLVRERSPWWEVAAIAPAVGLGFVYVIAEIASITGVRFDIPLFAVALVGLLTVTIVSAVRGRGAGSRIAPPERGELGAVALLGLAVLLGIAIWAVGLRGVEIPPNYDAAHHGLFTAQIDRFGNIDADQILANSNGAEQPVSSFYPLALHSAGALVAGPAPTTIADIWLAYAALFAAVVFPIGVFALARTLFPALPLAAGFASFLAPTVALFPYKPIAWGGIALIAGIAMMPGVITGASRVLPSVFDVRRLLYVALALVGLFATHSSEIPLTIVVALLLATTSMVALGPAVWLRRVLLNGVVIGASSVALLVPVLVPVIHGGAERLSFDDTPLAPIGTTIRSVVDLSAFTGNGAPILMILAGIGAIGALVRRTALAWLVAGVVVTAMYVTVSISDNPIAGILASPWYRQPERILYNLVIWLLPLAGLALASVAVWLGRRSSARWMQPVAIAFVAVAALALATPSARGVSTLMETWTSYYSPVGGDEIAAFEYLASVTESDELVLTDINADGSLWMYAFADVEPVILAAVTPTTSDIAFASYETRRSAATGVADFRTNPDFAAQLRALGIRYVYYDETGFPGSVRFIDFDTLRSDPAFVPVFEQGAAHVYRIDFEVLDNPERFTVSKPVLYDGGFDEGFMYWAPDSQLEAWSADATDDPSIIISGVSGQSTLYAVRVVGGAVAQWDVISAPPNRRFTVSFSLRPRVPSVGDVSFGLLFLDADGSPIETAGATSGPLENLDPGTWHHFTQDIQAPIASRTAIPVVTVVDIEGEVRIDGLDLRVTYQ